MSRWWTAFGAWGLFSSPGSVSPWRTVYPARKWIVALLTSFWGLRLCAYLSFRNWGKGEDPRYGKWREASGDGFWIVSLFKVFWLQALVLWVISLVIQIPQMSPQPARLTAWDGFGAAVWLIGFVFESVADRQLQRFKADPRSKGQVMDRGFGVIPGTRTISANA